MLVQSKSGTGKTLVFSIIAMEKFNPDIEMPQALILCPTREIAVQTADTLKTIGKYIPRFKAEVVIGGQSLKEDRQKLQGCSVVVASPGRILHLIELNVFNTKHINLLILDEVDALTDLNFNLKKILDVLERKSLQVITVSATLDKKTQDEVSLFMKNPIGITPAKEVPVLVGIGQFICRLPANEPGVEMLRKFAKLKEILSKVTFKQCFVFTNSQSLAESYKKLLAQEDWPSEVITGAYEQSQRLNVLRKLKEFKIRVLLATDLMARGIDAENVNLVINMDVPRNGMVYLHRIGRAGRFGTKGVAITLVATEKQEKEFEEIQEQFAMKELVMELPEKIESERIWRMVDEGEKRNQSKKSVTFEEKVAVNEEEEEEGETDALALLLDSSSLVDKKDKGEKKVAKSFNFMEEFEKFSESELVGKEKEEEVPEEIAIESASLMNNIDSAEELDSDAEEEEEEKNDEKRIHNSKKGKNKSKGAKNKSNQRMKWEENDDGHPLANWHNMFHLQYSMISDYVQRNRDARRNCEGQF